MTSGVVISAVWPRKAAYSTSNCSAPVCVASLLLEEPVLMEPCPYWTLARFVHEEFFDICQCLLSIKGPNEIDVVMALVIRRIQS